MPRRRNPDAEAERVKNARWRYALRHPDFRAELREVSHLHRKRRKEFKRKYDELLKKWGFQFIGLEIVDAYAASVALKAAEIALWDHLEQLEAFIMKRRTER